MMTIMSFPMFMIMMMAFCIRIIIKLSSKIIINNLIRISTYPRQKFNTNFRQSVSGSHSDASTDKRFYFCSSEKSCQSTVSGSIRINDL